MAYIITVLSEKVLDTVQKGALYVQGNADARAGIRLWSRHDNWRAHDKATP